MTESAEQIIKKYLRKEKKRSKKHYKLSSTRSSQQDVRKRKSKSRNRKNREVTEENSSRYVNKPLTSSELADSYLESKN